MRLVGVGHQVGGEFVDEAGVLLAVAVEHKEEIRRYWNAYFGG
jgi:hypothetical protein